MSENATQRPTCQFEWSGYPHPGCAEFGEPDHFECSAAATWRVSFPPSGPYDPDETVLDFCAEHAVEAIHEPGAESVLLADLPDIRCGDCGSLVWVLHPAEHASPCGYCERHAPSSVDTDHAECACPNLAAMNASAAAL